MDKTIEEIKKEIDWILGDVVEDLLKETGMKFNRQPFTEEQIERVSLALHDRVGDVAELIQSEITQAKLEVVEELEKEIQRVTVPNRAEAFYGTAESILIVMRGAVLSKLTELKSSIVN